MGADNPLREEFVRLRRQYLSLAEAVSSLIVIVAAGGGTRVAVRANLAALAASNLVGFDVLFLQADYNGNAGTYYPSSVALTANGTNVVVDGSGHYFTLAQ